MKRVQANYLVKLAAKFERLAQTAAPVTVPSTIRLFFSEFKRFMRKDIPIEVVIIWIQSNATVLCN